MAASIIILKGISVRLSELQFRFSRSSGHGGQNVNKVETRVELAFNVMRSGGFTHEQKNTITKRLSTRIDGEGNLRIASQKFRNQWGNRQETITRLIELLQKALTPRKKRTPTKAPVISKEKRLEQKKRRGELKKLRRVRPD